MEGKNYRRKEASILSLHSLLPWWLRGRRVLLRRWNELIHLYWLWSLSLVASLSENSLASSILSKSPLSVQPEYFQDRSHSLQFSSVQFSRSVVSDFL